MKTQPVSRKPAFGNRRRSIHMVDRLRRLAVPVIEFGNRGVVTHHLVKQEREKRRLNKRHITCDDRGIRRFDLCEAVCDPG